MLFGVDDLDPSIDIQDDVAIGSGVHIYTNNHRFDDPELPIKAQGHHPPLPVVIEKGAWIGANAILLPGVTIGKGAVVAAGAVVTRTYPPGPSSARPPRILKTLPTLTADLLRRTHGKPKHGAQKKHPSPLGSPERGLPMKIMMYTTSGNIPPPSTFPVLM
jgi:hypothetical protein